MGLLKQRFIDQASKDKNAPNVEASFDIMYSTGFLPLDFLNGYKVHVVTPTEDYFYNSIGIMDGSSNMFIGRTGSGKTSIAIQAGSNIIRRFPDAVMFYRDIEGGSNSTRREVLSKFTPEEQVQRIVYTNEGISAESFYKEIAMIYDEKINHRAEYEYDTGLVDNMGKKIYKLIPTVYVLDSLAMLVPDKITEEEELSGQMSTTATAKTNTAVFKRIVPKLKAANIILFSINHINDKVEINPFSHSKSSIAYLKPEETLPGGKAVQYVANNIIRVDDGAKLKASEGLGVDGKIVDFSFVKSRTNDPGKAIPMVFTLDHGFDEILSLFMFMKSNGAIETKGAYCTITGYPDMKFTQKGFKDKLYTDPEFAAAFNKVAKAELETLLNNPQDPEISKANQNIIDSILAL